MQLVKRPSSPFWYVRVQRNGKDFLRSTRETNKTRASERASALLNQIQDEAYGRAAPLQDRWLTDWWEEFWTARPDHGSQRIARSTGVHLRRHLGSYRLRELRPSHIQGYITKRLAEGAAETTVWNEGNLLKQVINAAIEDDLLRKNVATSRHVQWPRPVARQRVLTQQEEDALRRVLIPRYEEMLLVALWTGMRGSEVAGLRVERVSFPAQSLRVLGKGKKWRDIPLYPQVAPFLQRAMGDRTEGYVWPRASKSIRNTVVRMNDVYRHAWERAQLPGPPVTTHVFRHTFATRFLQAGGNIYILSKILGHSSVTVTEKVYAHLVGADVVKQALTVQWS